MTDMTSHRQRIAERRRLDGATDAELVLLATAGDRYSCEVLCRRNTRLVMWAVNRFDQIPGVERSDLEQLAWVGFVRATTSHNPDRSSLATWGVRQIRSAIAAGLPDLKPGVRLPAGLGKQVSRARTAAAEAPGETSAADVAGLLGVALDVASELLALTELDRPVELTDHVLDTLASDDPALDAVADADELAPLLAGLSELERRVIELRHGLTDAGPQTVAATATAIGCHRSTVERAEKRALTRMKGGI